MRHLEHRLCRARTGSGSPQLLPHVGQRLTRPLVQIAIGKELQRLGRCTRRREIGLNQFGHDASAGDEIRHRVHVHVTKRLHQSVGQRRQPVDDDHRLLVQRALNGCGPGRRDHHVRRRQHVVGSIAHEDHVGFEIVGDERREQRIGHRRRTRDDELRIGDSGANQRNGLGHHRHGAIQFVLAAARQQRHGGRGRNQTTLGQKRVARLARLGQIHQWVSDELHIDAGIAVQRLFERKDHEHAVDVGLHRLHAAGAPCP